MRQKNIRKFKYRVAKKEAVKIYDFLENHILRWRTVDYTKEDIVQEILKFIEAMKKEL